MQSNHLIFTCFSSKLINCPQFREQNRKMNTTEVHNLTYYETWNLSSNIWKILIAFISLLICFVTTAGNVLVLLSFRINKKLRTTNNYFLISLAIADLIIGFYSMPVFTLYFITEEWLLGPYICDLWLCLDYTVSNASVASLLLISFDRYFSITRPLTYRVNRTTKKVTFFIGLSWAISVLMWSPFIISWPFILGNRVIKDNECKVQFLLTNKYITLITASVAFYLPVTIICILYFQIWRVTKKRQVELRSLQCQNFSTNFRSSEQSRKLINNNNSLKSPDDEMKTSLEIKTNNKGLLARFFNCSTCARRRTSEDFFKTQTNNSVENYKYKFDCKKNSCNYCQVIVGDGINQKDSSGRVKAHLKVSKSLPVEAHGFKEIKCVKCHRYLNETNPTSTELNSKSILRFLKNLERIFFTFIYKKDLGTSETKEGKTIETKLVDVNGSQYTIMSISAKPYSHNNYEIAQRESKELRRKQEKKQDKKAAKTLSALLLAFLITWLPYNLNVVVNSFCNNCLDKYGLWQSFGNFLI